MNEETKPNIDAAVSAFCGSLAADWVEYRAERGPKGGWLFSSEETFALDRALEAAIRAAMARERARTAVSAELSEWKEERNERT